MVPISSSLTWPRYVNTRTIHALSHFQTAQQEVYLGYELDEPLNFSIGEGVFFLTCGKVRKGLTLTYNKAFLLATLGSNNDVFNF
jgi:hypothetical protein